MYIHRLCTFEAWHTFIWDFTQSYKIGNIQIHQTNCMLYLMGRSHLSNYSPRLECQKCFYSLTTVSTSLMEIGQDTSWSDCVDTDYNNHQTELITFYNMWQASNHYSI